MKKVISKLSKIFKRKSMSETFLEASQDPSKHVNLDPEVFAQIMKDMENAPHDDSLTTDQIIKLSTRNRDIYQRHNDAFIMRRIDEDTFETIIHAIPIAQAPSMRVALEKGNKQLFCEFRDTKDTSSGLKTHRNIKDICCVLFDITMEVKELRKDTHLDEMLVISGKLKLFGPRKDKLEAVINQAEQANNDIQISFGREFITGYPDRHTELIMAVIGFDVIGIKSIPSTHSTEK